MLSATALRENLYSLLKMVRGVGISNSLHMEFFYEHRVYELTITKTNREHHTYYPRRHNKPKRLPINIKPEQCETCGSLTIDNICINKKCDTNIKAKA